MVISVSMQILKYPYGAGKTCCDGQYAINAKKKSHFKNTAAVLYSVYWRLFGSLSQQKLNHSQSNSLSRLYAFTIILQRMMCKIVTKKKKWYLCSSLKTVIYW